MKLPTSLGRRNSLLRAATGIGLLLLVYFLFARLGLHLALAPGSASPVWPPAGIALGALLLWGPGLWPGIMLGETLAVLADGLPPTVAISMGCGNALGAWLAARYIRQRRMLLGEQIDLRDLLVFLAYALLLAPTISGVIGVTSLWLGGIVPTAGIWYATWTWWTGDALGILVIVPWLLAWRFPWGWHGEPTTFVRRMLIVLLAGVVALVPVFAVQDVSFLHAPVLFAFLPLLAWAALRHGLREVTSIILVLSAVMLSATAVGLGPFAGTDVTASLLAMQSYLGIIALTALVLATVVNEREQAATALAQVNIGLASRIADSTAALRLSNQQLAERNQFNQVVQDTLQALLLVLDRDGRIVSFNRACEQVSGYSAAEAIGCTAWDLVVPPEDRGGVQAVFAHLTGGMFPNEHTNAWMTRAGQRRLIEWRNSAICGGDGSVRYVVATGVDISERQRLHGRIERLLESIGDGIFGIDREMRITFVNPAVEIMLGYTRAQMIGSDMHALLHYAHEDGMPRERQLSLVQRTLRDGLNTVCDSEVFWTSTHQPVPVRYSVNPMVEDGSIVGAVVVFRGTADERAMSRHLDYLASHDSLTGLYNRRVFEEALRTALRDLRESDDEHVLCYLDLDQFKVVNDTCGHAAGDELLEELADLLKAHIRHGDMLARLGGDEFGLLLMGCPLASARGVLDNIQRALAEYRFVWETKIFSVGASIGVVSLDAHTESSGVALSQADAACYIAKDLGRNRTHVYESADRDSAGRHGEMQWVTRVRDALDADRLVLFAQAIVPVDPGTGGGGGCEILLRMLGDDGCLVPPGAFLPAAERYGLAAQIDRWVVSRAFAILAAGTDAAYRGLAFITINVSGRTIGDPEFLELMIHLAHQHPELPKRLCVEITETAAVANIGRARRFIQQLKQIGFRFALDDFGSGMSSFSYLKNLDVDYLKVDGNFVRDIATDAVDRAMVEAINKVAQVMGLHTIAEFVETPAVLEHLRAIGVDYAQGYALGYPVPLEEYLATVRAPTSVAEVAAPDLSA